jgi:hypothetical protein
MKLGRTPCEPRRIAVNRFALGSLAQPLVARQVCRSGRPCLLDPVPGRTSHLAPLPPPPYRHRRTGTRREAMDRQFPADAIALLGRTIDPKRQHLMHGQGRHRPRRKPAPRSKRSEEARVASSWLGALGTRASAHVRQVRPPVAAVFRSMRRACFGVDRHRVLLASPWDHRDAASCDTSKSPRERKRKDTWQSRRSGVPVSIGSSLSTWRLSMSSPRRFHLHRVLCQCLVLGWPGLEGGARNPGPSFANATSSPGHPTEILGLGNAIV